MKKLVANESRVYVNCLAFQLSLARKKVLEYYEERLRPFGLTPTYVYVLGVLRDDGPSSLTHIAQALQLERATMSTLLARMERDGFIVRCPGQERRMMRVELTEKGREIMERTIGALVQADEELSQSIEGRLDEVKQLLSIINHNM